MKALVYTGVKQMEFLDVPDPVPSSDDSLIDIRSVGICGSDMHAYLGHDERRPAPLILGHEAAGNVIAGPMVGKRVTINPLVTCQKCEACITGRSNLCASRQIISMQPREGAFAEQVAMPARNLVAVPDTISFDHAALAEPLAVCWHAIRLGQEASHKDLAETRCLVIGGGAIGVGSALCLRAKGVKDIAISEPNARRQEVLKTIGDFRIYDPQNGHGPTSRYDLIVDAVGFSGSRADACALAKPGGVIVHIGLGGNDGGLDIRRLTLQEIKFIGTYTYTEQDFKDTAQAIFDHQFGDLNWIETRALDEGASAFADIISGKVAAPKIVLNP